MRLLRTLSTAALTLMLLASPAWAGDGASLLPLLPSSADAVVGVNVQQLRSAALYEQVVSMARSNDDASSALNEISVDGFDPIASAQTVVIASDEVSDDAAERMLVLVETAYPREGLSAKLLAEGFEASELHGLAVFRKSQSTVAFLGDSLLAIGHFDLVSGAATAHAGQGTAGLGSALAAQATAVDKSGAIWFATAALPSNPQGAQRARLSISFASGFALQAVIGLDTAVRAESAVADFESQRTTLMGSPEVAAFGLAPVLSGTTLAADGSDLQLGLTLDAATWNGLVATLTSIVEEQLR